MQSNQKHLNLSYAIALTGGIGSGKSTTKDMLLDFGHEVICADSIAHIVLEESIEEIVAHFGKEILDSTNKINRKALGKIVFSSPKERKILESITHPKIHDKIMQKAKILESSKKWYFLDIPLFFESGGKVRYPVKFVLTIVASEDIQIERIKSRDNLSTQDAKNRIKAQLNTQTKISKSDYVIYNNSSKQNLKNEIEKFLTWLDNKADNNARF